MHGCVGGCTRGAKRNKARPTASASASSAEVIASPNKVGKMLAQMTPASAKPSRQATMRVCCTASPPSRAPQAWCSTLNKL